MPVDKFLEAIQKGDFKKVKENFERISDKSPRMDLLDCGLELAIQVKNSEVIKYLMDQIGHQGVRIKKGDFVESERVLPLNIAVKYNNMAAVKYLVKNGADVNTKDFNDETPLIYACKHRNLEVLKYLIAQGAKEGMAEALTVSAGFGEIEIVKYLLKKGANPNEKGFYRSPLASAARSGSLDVVKYLLKKGAKTKDKAIIEAVGSHSPETVRYLLKKGAHVNAKDGFGFSVLDIAEKNSYLSMTKLLKKHGAK